MRRRRSLLLRRVGRRLSRDLAVCGLKGFDSIRHLEVQHGV